MGVDRYFRYKLDHIIAGVGVAIIAGLIWCVIKLFSFLSMFTLKI